jgi:hypothetical protein
MGPSPARHVTHEALPCQSKSGHFNLLTTSKSPTIPTIVDRQWNVVLLTALVRTLVGVYNSLIRTSVTVRNTNRSSGATRNNVSAMSLVAKIEATAPITIPIQKVENEPRKK